MAKMTPLSLIRKYFRTAASLPDPGAIADAGVLARVAGTFVPVMVPLCFFRLDEAERTSLGHKDPIDQRRRSQAFLGLIRKRPSLGLRAEVDPQVFQTVIEKDDTADLLSHTLGQLGQIVADGALIVSAEVSRQVTSALTWARDRLQDRALPAAELRRLRLCFNSVDQTAADQASDPAPEEPPAAPEKTGRTGKARKAVRTIGHQVQLQETRFSEFLAVPAEDATTVAVKLAEQVARSGIELLKPALRNELVRRIDHVAVGLCPDVIRAVVRFSPSAGVNGVTGGSLERVMEQQGAMAMLSRAVRLSKELVDDGRRVLQAWQFEAQARIVGVLLADLTGPALSPDEQRQLAIDADPVLKVIEEQIAEVRGTRRKKAKALAVLKEQTETARMDSLLLQTMRDLREGRPVDPEVRRTVAAHYVQRIREGAFAAPSGLDEDDGAE